ncbi:MAG: hypothetical protein OEZ15_06665 [Gammaproteobacteria bacterium]|nr:hypothetical protein [Gammaproteobacteria bacterium]
MNRSSTTASISLSTSNIVSFLLAILLSISVNTTALANDSSFVELTKSSKSETLDDIYTFGLYATLTGDSQLSIYSGVQFMEIESDNLGLNNSVIKIFIGQSFGEIFSPFYEIGTDLYGLLSLLDNNNDREACAEEQQCAVDFFFRIGLRINMGKVMIGIYHENIDFGDFHSSLSGEHRYTGSSIAFRF